jgi:hypothetical protein
MGSLVDVTVGVGCGVGIGVEVGTIANSGVTVFSAGEAVVHPTREKTRTSINR